MNEIVELTVRLTEADRKALLQGARLSITVLPPVRQRRENIQQEAEARGLPQGVVELVALWNGSRYVKTHTEEPRNNPITDDQVDELRPYFERALREIGLQGIGKAMAVYFKACEAGRHIWDYRNHGYSHLGGFVRKLIDCHKSGKRLWWSDKQQKMEDDHPNLTMLLADKYAEMFLRRKEYGLRNPSTQYGQFWEAAEKIVLLVRKDKSGTWTKKRLVRELLVCVRSQSRKRGYTVTPAWLCSEMTWMNDLPQHLRRVSGKE